MRRRAMLSLPHMAPLAAEALRSRRETGAETPDFDPADGGAAARILFLLEKPGPMTSPRRPGGRPGSGFVSRDNDDPTAEAIHVFMRGAGIERADTVLWNIVPWWNGTTRVTAAEVTAGLAALGRLPPLLPRLRAVVLVGRVAARAAPLLSGYAVYRSDHPSPQVRAAFPERWHAIPERWREVATALSASRDVPPR